MAILIGLAAAMVGMTVGVLAGRALLSGVLSLAFGRPADDPRASAWCAVTGFMPTSSAEASRLDALGSGIPSVTAR